VGYPLTDQTYKTCSNCGTLKNIVEFHKHARGLYGRRSQCKQCEKVKHADYYLRNKDACNQRSAAWYKSNQELHNARCTERRKNIDKQTLKKYRDMWRKLNHDAGRRYHHTRRVRESGMKLSAGIVDRLMKLQNGKCACCGRSLNNDINIDHIMPLALGGKNCDDNVQLLHEKCNKRKATKHPVDFMRAQGFLL
jgi:5-methylcytosine-specific restriction endonuclease McrA